MKVRHLKQQFLWKWFPKQTHSWNKIEHLSFWSDSFCILFEDRGKYVDSKSYLLISKKFVHEVKVAERLTMKKKINPRKRHWISFCKGCIYLGNAATVFSALSTEFSPDRSTQQRLQHLAGLLMATWSFSSAAGRLGEPKLEGSKWQESLLATSGFFLRDLPPSHNFLSALKSVRSLSCQLSLARRRSS